MKKILITTLVLFGLISCGGRDNSEPPQLSRFKVGDIIYLKPDSTKAVVDFIYSSDRSSVNYMDSL